MGEIVRCNIAINLVDPAFCKFCYHSRPHERYTECHDKDTKCEDKCTFYPDAICVVESPE